MAGGTTASRALAGKQRTRSESTSEAVYECWSRTSSVLGIDLSGPMKVWLVLLSADAVMCWWFANSMLMLLRPGRAKYFIWWPELRETAETPETLVLPRKNIRIMGLVFAIASGTLLFRVLAPATVGLFLLHLRR